MTHLTSADIWLLLKQVCCRRVVWILPECFLVLFEMKIKMPKFDTVFQISFANDQWYIAKLSKVWNIKIQQVSDLHWYFELNKIRRAPLPPPLASPCTHPRPWLTAPACFQAEVDGSVVAVAGSQVLTLCTSTSSEPRQSKQTCMCILVTDTPGNRNIGITYSINRRPSVLGIGTKGT